VADRGHRSYSRTNPYFTAEDPSLPETDPRRRFFERSNAFVPADNFKPDGALRTVFDSDGFDEFIRECLQEPRDRFFRYADPLADVIVNTATEGNGFPGISTPTTSPSRWRSRTPKAVASSNTRR
jgi:hypothetical protein